MKHMITIAVIVVSILVISNVATWKYRGTQKDQEFALRIATAVPETVWMEKEVKIPGKRVTVPAKPETVTIEDAMKIAKLINDNDSLQFELAKHLTTQSGTMEDTVQTIIAWYYPMAGTFEIDYRLKSLKVPYPVINNKVPLPQEPPKGEPWLKVGVGINYREQKVIGNVWGNVKVLDRTYIVPNYEIGNGFGVNVKYSVIEF